MSRIAAIDPHGPDPGLDPALAQGLSGQAPRVRAAARRAIARCFAARVAADGSDAWHGSTLTGDGFPLEFAVAARDPQLRFSCEPGSRTLAPQARLQLASELAEQLGDTPLPAEPLAALRWAHHGASLRYGGWLGVRVSAEGAIATKLYAELSPDHPPPLLGDRVPGLPDRPAQPRMLGICGDGSSELYLRVPSLLPAELPALLAPAGLADRAGEVLAVLSESYGQHLQGRVPGSSVGVSYAPDAQGCTVTLYLFARALWGSDSRIRQRFAALIANPAQRRAYLSATAPLAARDEWATRHGLAGLVLRPGAPPSWVIGFRPMPAG